MTKVIMHKTLCTALFDVAEKASVLRTVLLGHSFLTKKQKLALDPLRNSLVEIVKLHASGVRPKEIEQGGGIAAEDSLRYRTALEVIYKEPCLDPEANAALAQAALYPPIPEEELGY